jgi:hypothetical protein
MISVISVISGSVDHPISFLSRLQQMKTIHYASGWYKLLAENSPAYEGR